MTNGKDVKDIAKKDNFDEDIFNEDYDEELDGDIDDEEDDDKPNSSSDMNCRENVIEFLKGEKTITVTFSQRKYITKVKNMAKQYPNQVEILAENEDGSLCAHLPLNALHLYISKKREISEDEREQMRKRMKRMWSKKNSSI